MRSGRSIWKLAAVSVIATFSFFPSVPALALPEFLVRFARDPFSRAEYRTQCSTCHANPVGGGPRNPFGTAFEKNKHVVTPEFRQAWPSHFLPSVSTEPVAAQSGQVKATFLANDQEMIVEIGGSWNEWTRNKRRS